MLRTILSGVVAKLVIAVCWPLSIASAQTAERVFSLRSPSIVVVRVGTDRQGSGVVVAPRLVATNCHVTDGSGSISVRRGRVGHGAIRAWAQSVSDICLLDVPTLDAVPVPIGLASNLRVGAQVFAIGAPAGLELTLSAGIVSQLRQEGDAPLVQTSASISPGSSGGGLFDARGQLVGITTMSVREGQNLNFAVPVEWLRVAIAGLEDWRKCRASPTTACLIASAKSVGEATGDEPSVVHALLDIARAYFSVGSRTQAEAALADATEYARRSPSISKRSLLIDVATAFREAGNSTRSMELLRESLAEFLTPQNAGPRTNSNMTLEELMPYLFLERLTESFDQIGADRESQRVRDEERRFIDELPTRRGRVTALMHLAERQSRSADPIAATQILTKALEEGREGDESTQIRIRNELRRQQVRNGNSNGALAEARRITDVVDRLSAILAVAEAQASEGDANGAARTLAEATRQARLEDPSSRSSALRSVAAAAARMEKFTDALTLAREIRDIVSRTGALTVIALRQARAAASADAARTISEVLALINQLPVRDRDDRLRSISGIQAGIGSIETAFATVSRITNPDVIIYALIDISEAQEHHRDFAGRVLTLRRIYTIYRSPANLGAVARAQAQSNDIEGALVSLDGVDDQRVIIATLGGIAAALVNRR